MKQTKRSAIFLTLLLFSIGFSSCSNGGMRRTTLTLEDVRQIGELESAEFYGEVISGSLKDNNSILNKLIANNLNVVQSELTQKLKAELDLRRQQVRANAVESGNSSWFFSAKNAPEFDSIKERNAILESFRRPSFEFSRASSQSLDFIVDRIEGRGNRKKLKNLIVKAVDEAWENDVVLARFNNTFQIKEKKNLIYLGRGYVKSGIKLSEIDSTDLRLSEDQRELYIYNLDPVLTNVDINPTFYFNDKEGKDDDKEGKEEPIPGYELLYPVQGNETFNWDEISAIKKDCKLELLNKAISTGIFKHALVSAEDGLTALLSMVPGKKGVGLKKVHILPSKYHLYYQEYVRDLEVDADEFKELSELIRTDYNVLDTDFFNGEALDYQRRHLHKFIVHLHEATQLGDNDPRWNAILRDYESYTTPLEESEKTEETQASAQPLDQEVGATGTTKN